MVQTPLSPCQVWWGSDFPRHRGAGKFNVFFWIFFLFLPVALRAAYSTSISVTQGNFAVFLSAVAIHYTSRGEIWRGGAYQCRYGGMETPKLKNVTKISAYKRPAMAYPLM